MSISTTKGSPYKLPRPISAAKWAAMTNPQKAVAIAKDAIFRVESGQFMPATGNWSVIEAVYTIPSTEETGVYEDDVQKMLKAGASCECCALGGSICSLAAIENQMTEDEADWTHAPTRRRLAAIFGLRNLQLIEHAFECGYGYNSATVENASPAKARKAEEFGDRYLNDRERFLAIWQNVAANEGVFTP